MFRILSQRGVFVYMALADGQKHYFRFSAFSWLALAFSDEFCFGALLLAARGKFSRAASGIFHSAGALLLFILKALEERIWQCFRQPLRQRARRTAAMQLCAALRSTLIFMLDSVSRDDIFASFPLKILPPTACLATRLKTRS